MVARLAVGSGAAAVAGISSMPMTKREIERFLAQPNVAVVAVAAPDGSPHAVPTWYEYRRGTVVMHSDTSAFKYRCLRRDPRITLCVDTRQPPYKGVVLKGRAKIEIKKDDARLTRMSIAYLGRSDGEAYARSLAGVKLAVISFRPAHVVSWDYARDSS